MTDFIPYPKTPRLRREVVITEKIDGTNAAVQIERAPTMAHPDSLLVPLEDENYFVTAQSRKRIITPDDDNFGFARWAHENARALVETLGEGTHFGEWWGSGIQRGYGLQKGEKRFSLFNAGRWAEVDLSAVPGLGVVPVLANEVLSDGVIDSVLFHLTVHGSQAAPGFMNPEGIIVFHTQSRQVYKVLLENDEMPKGAVA